MTEKGCAGDGGKSWGGGMDAIVAQMNFGGTLVTLVALELAVWGHFGHSEWGLSGAFGAFWRPKVGVMVVFLGR